MILPAPKKSPRSTDTSILPLINIVFLLLIFFMLTGVLAQRPPFNLTPPTTHQTAGSTHLQQKVLAVGINGQIAFGGKKLDKTKLTNALSDWPKGKILQVRADGRIKARELAGLLTRLRRAGVGEINLLTRHTSP